MILLLIGSQQIVQKLTVAPCAGAAIAVAKACCCNSLLVVVLLHF
jgi:hypothetical protein